MLPEMPSTMLGHERPPRRARPDDPGQPGAGDARGRSDAARSAAGPYTDTGGGAAITYGITIRGVSNGTDTVWASNPFAVAEPFRYCSDCGAAHSFGRHIRAGAEPHCDTCTCATPDTRAPADIGTATNPDSDPAT
jgi:hypothetical protein